MNPWTLLGIEPGSDRKSIKKAYTRLIREVNPEDHPDEFMQLREAYERALKTLESPSAPRVFSANVSAPENDVLDTVAWDGDEHQLVEDFERPETVQQARTIRDEATLADRHTEDDRRDRQINELTTAMSHLMDNPDLRNRYDHWAPLLEGPEYDDFLLASETSRWLLSHVVYRLQTGGEQCPFEPELLSRLDERFQWTADHSNMPIAEQDAIRLSLLIEAANHQQTATRTQAGWEWLSHTLFSFSGRLSRVECLLGLAAVLGAMLLTYALSLALPKSDTITVFIVTGALVSIYCITSLMVKRIRDMNVNPIVAALVGIIFPVLWILFLLGAPRDNDRDEDPRLKFTPIFKRTYQELYAGHHGRPLKLQLTERLNGILPDVYWAIAGLWLAGFCLLLVWRP